MHISQIILISILGWFIIISCKPNGNKIEGFSNRADSTYEEYYSDGTLKLSLDYRNDLPHGDLIIFYPNGKIKFKGHLNFGKIIGKTLLLDSTGNTIQESTFLNDIRVGQTKYYYPSGQVMGLINYKNPPYSKMDSINLHLFDKDEGIIGMTSFLKQIDPLFSNGLRHGSEIWFYQNGQISKESYFKNDDKDSIDREYYHNGEIKIEKLWEKDHFGPVYSNSYDSLGNILDSK